MYPSFNPSYIDGGGEERRRRRRRGGLPGIYIARLIEHGHDVSESVCKFKGSIFGMRLQGIYFSTSSV